MKRTVISILAAAAFLMMSTAYSRAQVTQRVYDDNATYLDSAREKAMLFRGMLAPEYRFQYNGHCYASEKEFRQGQVLYNGRLYDGVFLNVDASKQVLVVKEKLIFATDTKYVDYAWIGDRKYVNLRYQDRVPDAPEGLLRAEYEGEYSFYSHVKKTLASDSEYHNGDDIGYFDPEYKVSVNVGGREVKVTMYFDYNVKYYMVVDGKCTQVKSRAKFLSFFDKPTAKAMKKYAVSKHLDGSEVSLAMYAQMLLAYRDSELVAKEGVR